VLQSRAVEEHVLQKYKSFEGAESYNTKYDDELHKRINNRFEFALIRRCMEVVGPQDLVLDLPSGTGRLSPVVRPWAKRVIESDVSMEMLKFCRRNWANRFEGHPGGVAAAGAGGEVEGFAQASAFHLPYRDRAFDCVFSSRLTHHIPDPNERDQFIRELGRVSKRWVVMTYFHKWSLKNLLRMLRSPFNRKKPKVVMSTGEFRAVAATAGLELLHSWPLSRLASGHHFAVLRRLG
jgi:SAM-dependent methyltransferase